jgi:hypothetical protein
MAASRTVVVLCTLLLGIVHGIGVAATPRAALLNAIAPLERGFKATAQQRKEVAEAIETLARSTSQQYVPDISGDWELVYTDAPDILGLDVQAGPFSTCTRIGQQISETDGTIANVIEYGPRPWAASLVKNVISQVEGDRLQQRVITSFERRQDEPTKVDLKIRGAAFVPKQLLGVSLDALPPLRLGGFVEPPFGSFEVLYCEGPEGPPTGEAAALEPEMEQLCELEDFSSIGPCASIRVVRTAQGYYSINRRMTPAEGWGDA